MGGRVDFRQRKQRRNRGLVVAEQSRNKEPRNNMVVPPSPQSEIKLLSEGQTSSDLRRNFDSDLISFERWRTDLELCKCWFPL